MEDRDVPRRTCATTASTRPACLTGPINGERFRAYVDQFLVPTLKPGDVVILDNLGSHKGKAVRKAIRDVGARLVFLPKYSPDLNPIEQVFAKFGPCPKGRGAKLLKPSAKPAAKSSPNIRPPNAPHTSKTPDTRRPKSRTL